MLTASKLAGFLLVGLMLVTPTSVAQGTATDPDAGTPAGTIYELPLDSARNDAAPKRRNRPPSDAPPSGGSQSGDGQSSTRPSSAIRSENGFGSSTSVPGTEDGTGIASAGGTGDGGSGAGSSRSGILAPESGATGAPPPRSTVQAATGDGGSDPSGVMTYGLLALVLAAGIAGGLVTRRRRHTPR